MIFFFSFKTRHDKCMLKHCQQHYQALHYRPPPMPAACRHIMLVCSNHGNKPLVLTLSLSDGGHTDGLLSPLL